MQIDFHYGVIYVVSRLAGMAPASAATIAHACQYVDDASNYAPVNAAASDPAVAARWKESLQTPVSWAAFHFIPGGEGARPDEKAICRPNSPAAISAVERAIEGRGSAEGLHRLGVALHSYVDTWAHQDFSGLVSRHNLVLYLEGDQREFDRTSARWQRALNIAGASVAALTCDLFFRLGHGAALSYPDMPWMKWGYRNGRNQRIDRDNLQQFMLAADMACRAVRGYLNGNRRFLREPGLGPSERCALERLLLSNRHRNRFTRLAAIYANVAGGAIPGLCERMPEYVGNGHGSWDRAAQDMLFSCQRATRDQRLERFEESDYRRVRTAIAQHRRDLIDEILPANGIVLA